VRTCTAYAVDVGSDAPQQYRMADAHLLQFARFLTPLIEEKT
jgi:hypothetical protein